MSPSPDLFGALGAIADILTNAPKALQEHKDKQHRREYAKALIACYLTLQDLIQSSDSMIDDLEGFVRGFERYSDQGDYSKLFRDRIQSDLHKESVGLSKLVVALEPIVYVLGFFEPDAAHLLHSPIHSRTNAISHLAMILNSGGFPTDGYTPKADNDLHDLEMLFGDSVIRTQSQWDKITYERIKLYLANNAPKERLMAMRKCVTILHQTLIKNFTLEEILDGIDEFRNDTTHLRL